MQINFILGEKQGVGEQRRMKRTPRGENWKQEWVLDEFVRCKSNSFTCLHGVMSVLYSTCIFQEFRQMLFLGNGVRVFKSVIKESESQSYNTTLWNQIFSQKRS